MPITANFEKRVNALSKSKTYKVNYLARVEGEGGLQVRVKDGTVSDVKLNIFEPPRFFEGFLVGRNFMEVPDITARICGICPIAYQMSSCHALEEACGVTVDGPLRELRRLIYCGEWIESHALHMFLLHAPDFLGYQDAMEMAADYPVEVEAALKIKKAGNDLMSFIGGREIHPINVRVGGFYKVPTRAELRARRPELEAALELIGPAVDFLKKLPIPEFAVDYEYVSLQHPDEYPLNEGRVVTTSGLDIPISEFPTHFIEEHVKHSTSLHGRTRDGRWYHVGPLARFAHNFDRLSEPAKDAAKAFGLTPTITNPFSSILVRAVELVYAFHEALRIIDNYEEPEWPHVDVVPRTGSGTGCTEAPRGLCWHTYSIDDDGLITKARIVPPTSQNQKTIEEDLRLFVQDHLDLPEDDLVWRCEQVVRNYDPCISCSCHFLKLDMIYE